MNTIESLPQQARAMAERLRDPNEVPGYDSTMRNVGNTIAHQAAALLVALAEAVEWRPIETAPKDGTRIIGGRLARPDTRSPFEVKAARTMFWHIKRKRWIDEYCEGGEFFDPNVWIPSPPKPTRSLLQEALPWNAPPATEGEKG
jgi:hypothetical protein